MFNMDDEDDDALISVREGDDENEDDISDEELESASGEWDERIGRYNTVHLTGRVGSTPEAKYFDDGKVVVNLSLASRRKYHATERTMYKIKSGEEATDWYGLEIWVSQRDERKRVAPPLAKVLDIRGLTIL